MTPEQTSEYFELRVKYLEHIRRDGDVLTEAEIGKLILLDVQMEEEWKERGGEL
jgi:hypothetical protein